jgi:rubredoxin
MLRYVCDLCGYEYINELGDVENKVAPMTHFEDLPEEWVCPWCGAGKDYFLRIEKKG